MTGRGRGRGTFARWTTNVTLGKCQTIDSTAQIPQCESETSETFDPVRTLPDNNVIVEEDSNELDIRVTHILDVEHFWAQLGMPGELEKFDKYLHALRQWCDKQVAWKDSGRLAGVVTGQVVCVKCASTGTWDRGQVTRLSDNFVIALYALYEEEHKEAWPKHGKSRQWRKHYKEKVFYNAINKLQIENIAAYR